MYGLSIATSAEGLLPFPPALDFKEFAIDDGGATGPRGGGLLPKLLHFVLLSLSQRH